VLHGFSVLQDQRERNWHKYDIAGNDNVTCSLCCALIREYQKQNLEYQHNNVQNHHHDVEDYW
jgi:hypothetical protein